MILFRCIAATSLLLLISFAEAQEQGVPAGEIEDQQVIIEKDKPLSLPKANRIYQRTDIRSIDTDTIRMNYQITQPAYNFNPYFARFSYKPFEPESGLAGDYSNYVKAGYGNYGSPLVQGFLGVEYEGNSAGIWLNHESFSRGPVREEESAYSISEVLLNATLRGDNLSLSPEIYYQRESYFFYGYDAEALSLVDISGSPFITDRVVADHFSLSTDLNAWKAEKFRFTVAPFYQFTSMREKGEEAFNLEHKAGLSGTFGIELGDRLEAAVKSGFTHFGYESGITQTRDIFYVNPFLTFQNEVLRLKGGLKYFSGNDSLSSGPESYIYPDLEAHLRLNEKLSVFARLSGELSPTGLNDLRLANRYLQDSLLLLNQHVEVDFQGGVESVLSEKMLLRAFVQYKQIDNQSLFFHSWSDSSRFSVLYDAENFRAFGVGLEGRYFVGKQTSLSASFLFSGYETDTVSEAWYLPTLRFDLIASHTINEVFKLRTTLRVLEGIQAPDPVSFESVDLRTIINWGIGIQYDFLPNAGTFVHFENILAQNYQQYLNYPARSLMMKLGFIYRF